MTARGRHPGNRRRRHRLVALLLLVVVGTLGPALPASAHAALATADPVAGAVLPTAPRSARLSFSEPVSPVPGGFALYDSDGRYPDDQGPTAMDVRGLDTVVTAELPADLAPGSYLLSWRVVSADSHPVSGVLTFVVGAPSPTPPQAPAGDPDSLAVPANAVLLVVQVLGYLGLLGGVGLRTFDLLVLRRRPGPGRDRLAVTALTLAGVCFGLLAGLGVVRERAGSLADLGSGATWRAALGSPGAAAFALVAAGSLLLLATDRLPARGGKVLTALGALVAVAAVLPTGHTRSLGPGWLMAGLDLVHVATGAVWFGGLLGLGRHLRRQHRQQGDPVLVAAVVARFSALAGTLVVLLGVSGAVLAVRIVGTPAAVLGTGYGRTLLTKLALVAVVAVLALWNKVHLVRVVARRPGPGPQWGRLRAAVLDETLLVLAVLAVTGLLTWLSPVAPAPAPGAPPAAVPAAGPRAGLHRAQLGSGSVAGRLSPAQPGVNSFEFTLRDADGQPASPAELPVVSARLPAASLGPVGATVTRLPGTGHYRAELALPAAGRWRIQVGARTDRFTEPTATLLVEVGR